MSSPTDKRSRSCSPSSYDLDLDAEPSSKRNRFEEEVAEMLIAEHCSDSSGSATDLHSFHERGIVHDDTYYMHDGSCILQVEDTLFNVSLLFSMWLSRLMADWLSYRCIGHFLRKTIRYSALCLNFRKASTRLRARPTAVLSFCKETRSKNSKISYGSCTHCKRSTKPLVIA